MGECPLSSKPVPPPTPDNDYPGNWMQWIVDFERWGANMYLWDKEQKDGHSVQTSSIHPR